MNKKVCDQICVNPLEDNKAEYKIIKSPRLLTEKEILK